MMNNPIKIIIENIRYSFSIINQKYNIAVENLRYSIEVEQVINIPTEIGIGVMKVGSTNIVG